MRLLVIGDPHGNLKEIKKIPTEKLDLILLTGDLGSSNLMRKIAFEDVERKKKGLSKKIRSVKETKDSFLEPYISSIKVINYLRRFAPVHTIFGNVESSNKEIREISIEVGVKLPFIYDKLVSMKNVKVINNKISKFENLKIGGLGYFTDVSWVREFKPKGSTERMKEAKIETNKAKRILKWFNKLDILICHQPPYGVLDKVSAKFAPKSWQGKHAGSKVVLDYTKKMKPRYVFCGHIHEGKGVKKIGKTEVHNFGSCGWKIFEF